MHATGGMPPQTPAAPGSHLSHAGRHLDQLDVHAWHDRGACLAALQLSSHPGGHDLRAAARQRGTSCVGLATCVQQHGSAAPAAWG